MSPAAVGQSQPLPARQLRLRHGAHGTKEPQVFELVGSWPHLPRCIGAISTLRQEGKASLAALRPKPIRTETHKWKVVYSLGIPLRRVMSRYQDALGLLRFVRCVGLYVVSEEVQRNLSGNIYY